MATLTYKTLADAKAKPESGKNKDGAVKEWQLFAFTGIDADAIVTRGISAIPAKGADEKDDAYAKRVADAIASLPRKTVFGWGSGEAVKGYPVARDCFYVEGGLAEKQNASAAIADANKRAADAEEARKKAEAQAKIDAENLQRTIKELEAMKAAYAEAQARMANANGPGAKQTAGRK